MLAVEELESSGDAFLVAGWLFPYSPDRRLSVRRRIKLLSDCHDSRSNLRFIVAVPVRVEVTFVVIDVAV